MRLARDESPRQPHQFYVYERRRRERRSQDVAFAKPYSGDQIFGDKTCHPERSEGSRWPHAGILSEAKDDKPDLSSIRSQEVLSPNIYQATVLLDVNT